MKHFVRMTRQQHEYSLWYDAETNELVEGFGGWNNMHTFAVRINGRMYNLTERWGSEPPFWFVGYL